MKLAASRELRAVIREQDREMLRRLQAYRPEGPLDQQQTDAAIERLIKRLEENA
jgi:hypothetical protein